MKRIILLSVLIVGILAFSACTEEGLGGKSSISGNVEHHGQPIPHAIVYIKYGASELPGTTPADYDAQVVAGADAHYIFEGLEKGDYYLYGIGYDSLIFENVVGGIYVDLHPKEDFETDIPVTE